MCESVMSLILFTVVVCLSCLPPVTACTPSYFFDCGFSQRTMITVTAACVAIAVFLVIFALVIWRRRRFQSRVTSTTAAADVPQNRPPKPQYAPPNQGHYSVYYQTAPPPVHIPQYPQYPQYPPRDFPTYNSRRHSGSQTLSSSSNRSSRPTAQASPMSMPVTPPLQRRDDSSTAVPSLALPPPRRVQENVAVSHSPSVPSSPPPPRTPQVHPQPSSVSLNPFSAASPPSAARHQALSPMQTGASNNVTDEPPPAYTPI